MAHHATKGVDVALVPENAKPSRLRPSERVTPTPGRLLPWRETTCKSCHNPFEQPRWRKRVLCRACRPWKARG